MCKGAQMCSEILLKCISFNLGLQCSFLSSLLHQVQIKHVTGFRSSWADTYTCIQLIRQKCMDPGPPATRQWDRTDPYPIPHTPKSRGWVLQRHQTDPKPDRRLSSKAVETRINRTISNPIQWNLPVTTTSIIKFNTCNLFSNVF